MEHDEKPHTLFVSLPAELYWAVKESAARERKTMRVFVQERLTAGVHVPEGQPREPAPQAPDAS